MTDPRRATDRREFLRRTTFGLAAVGVGGLTLRADARPTRPSGDLEPYRVMLEREGVLKPQAADELTVTERNALGPFYKSHAPMRGKISPPLSAGKTLVVRGRVWAHDTRKPLAGALLDIWQADEKGRYPMPADDKDKTKLLFRARLISDEDGYYEYETVRPGQYGRRPSHIHYLVRAAGYKPIITQMYFKGDPRNATDGLVRPSLIIETQSVETPAGKYDVGTFDVVLAKNDS